MSTIESREAALPLQTRLAPIASVEAEARTVEVIWTTGATVRRRRWRGWDEAIDYDETLVVTDAAVDLSRMSAGAPVLESHAQWSTRSVMAVVDRAWIGGGEGRALVRFPKAGLDPEADRLFGKVADGIIRNVSVGYAIGKVRVEKPERQGEVERWFVERWTPHEISFVAIGADPGAQVRDAERAPPTFPVTFDFPGRSVRTQESSMDDDVRSDAPAGATEIPTEERAAAPVATPSVQPTAPVAAATADAVDRVRTEERERASAIYELAERFRLDRSFADDLVRRGVALAEVRSQVLDRLAERDNRGAGLGQISVPAGGLDADVTRREAMVEAVLHRVAPTANALPERARDYRGMSLVDLARSCAAAAGMTVRGLNAHEIVDAAFGRSRGDLMLRTPPGYHGTTDFPMVLANVAGKRLRQAFQTAPRTFQRWTRGITAPDFKPLFPTQIGNFPALLPVMEGAEFSYGTLAESRETYRLATFGRIVALTRQAIVNDDLRAFDRAINTAGMKAADLESGLVYNELLANPLLADGVALFSTAGGRANQGTAAGITETSLTQAIELMTQQREITPAGITGDQIINNFPKYILVPPGTRSIEARKIIAQTTPAQASQVNPYANSFEIIEEPRLFNTAGPQRWWLAADPSSVDTIEYAHLEGQIEPFLDQRVGFEVDGVEFKIRHDFAAKAIDFRGLFFNAGV